MKPKSKIEVKEERTIPEIPGIVRHEQKISLTAFRNENNQNEKKTQCAQGFF